MFHRFKSSYTKANVYFAWVSSTFAAQKRAHDDSVKQKVVVFASEKQHIYTWDPLLEYLDLFEC
jgi:hypothetical protein